MNAPTTGTSSLPTTAEQEESSLDEERNSNSGAVIGGAIGGNSITSIHSLNSELMKFKLGACAIVVIGAVILVLYNRRQKKKALEEASKGEEMIVMRKTNSYEPASPYGTLHSQSNYSSTTSDTQPLFQIEKRFKMKYKDIELKEQVGHGSFGVVSIIHRKLQIESYNI